MTLMRDDQDLERLLRDTLAGRALDVTTGPSWRGADKGSRRPQRWLAPLLAAAVVALATGSVVLVEHSFDDQRATHRTASPTQSPSPTPTPAPTTAVQSACRAVLPASWRTALAKGTTKVGAFSVLPLDVDSDGSVLVSRDFGTSRDVAVVAPDGRARSIYSIAAPNSNQVENGALDGKWAMIPVIGLPRFANGVDPTISRLEVVDVDTRATHTVAVDSDTTDAKHVIDGAALLDGHVYYDVRPVYGKQSGAMHEYDLASGTDRVIASGSLGRPVLLGRGVSWSVTPDGLHPQVRRAIPVLVTEDTNTTRPANALVTDGAAYAWVDAAGRIAWFGPGSTAPKRTARAAAGAAEVEAVVGPLVLFTDDADDARPVHILDTRTGAVTTAPSLGSPNEFGPPAARTGVFGGFSVTGTRPSGTTAPGTPITALVRIDAAKLPELHCG